MLNLIIEVVIEQLPIILLLVVLPLIYTVVVGDDGYDYNYPQEEIE